MAAVPIGTVGELWRYPISSLGGQKITMADVTTAGITGDRVGALRERRTGEIVNPPVVRRWSVAPQLLSRIESGQGSEISRDGINWHSAESAKTTQLLEETFGVSMQFQPYGSELSVQQRYAWKPIHLISLQSLQTLRELVPSSEIDSRRFRPNILVDLDGLSGMCPEYKLIGKEFSIGKVRLRGLETAGRCSFTTLKQHDIPEDRAILRALIKNFEKKFGIYCEVLEPGQVALGDRVMAEGAQSHTSDSDGFKPTPTSTTPRKNHSAAVPGLRISIGWCSSFAADSITRKEVEGIGAVAIVHEEGRFHAVVDRCPHAEASLSEGFTECGRIVCPVHFAEFDLETGKAFNEPPGCGNLKCFRVERVGDELFLIT